MATVARYAVAAAADDLLTRNAAAATDDLPTRHAAATDDLSTRHAVAVRLVRSTNPSIAVAYLLAASRIAVAYLPAATRTASIGGDPNASHYRRVRQKPQHKQQRFLNIEGIRGDWSLQKLHVPHEVARPGLGKPKRCIQDDSPPRQLRDKDYQ